MKSAYSPGLPMGNTDDETPRAAPTATTDAFYKFVLSLCGLCKGRPLYFKGIEDYLLEKLPGVRYLTRIRCLNYSMDCRHWEESFQQGSFSESAVAQKLDLQMSGIQSSDLTTMRDMNVIRYDREYLQHCCPTSSCIRRASDRAPVAWIMCHADLEMGAMLTTDGYRRRGLAKYIVHDLGTKMMQVFADRISLLYSDDPREYDFKLQMVTELTNSNTRRLFEQLGFRPVANVSWAECVFDHQQYQAQQRGSNPRL
ncbi:hypothetical protein GGF46_001313 [Coemansia sp. RSA 552]|nr:hypothetical protein GGF46_001313 [Coemansia sp. RSA 552]